VILAVLASRTGWQPTQRLLREKNTGFFSQVSWAEIRAGLSGSAGVLAYFFLAYYLLGTTLWLVVHFVGLPLLFIGFCSFLCHATVSHRLGRIHSLVGFTIRRRITSTADGLATDAQTVQMDYPNCMDHLEVLREKIGRLRLEIAQIQELNKQYRLGDRNDTEAQVAHGRRQERLQAIQQELAQLAGLSRKVQSVKAMKEKHRSRLHLVKRAS